MLFDCDQKLIRTLAREQKVGLRDVVIKPKVIGPNEVTFVGAKSMRGVEFTKMLEEKLTKIVFDYDPDDDDPDDEDPSDSDPDWEEPPDSESGDDDEDDELGD